MSSVKNVVSVSLGWKRMISEIFKRTPSCRKYLIIIYISGQLFFNERVNKIFIIKLRY